MHRTVRVSLRLTVGGGALFAFGFGALASTPQSPIMVAAAASAIGRSGGDEIAPKPSAKIAPPPTVRRNVTPTVRFTVQPPSLSWIKRAVYGWPYGTLSAKKESNRDVTDRVRPYTNRAQLVNP